MSETPKPKLKIEMLPVDALNEYEGNARQHGETDIAAIKASIEKFGFNDPIGIWGRDNVIVEGHGRLMAAKDLGMTEVPVIRLDHLTEEERRAYGLAHNKTAELSAWNFDALIPELKSIIEVNMEAFGFDDGSIEEEKYQQNEEKRAAKDPTSRIIVASVSLFGNEAELLAVKEIEPSEAEHILDGLNEETAGQICEQIAAALRGLPV